MPIINRRRFLQHSSLLAAAAVLPGCSDGSDRSSGTAIVIGSGFAGSVAALRLAEAGIRTTVLERGRQWTVEGPDTFPTTLGLDRRGANDRIGRNWGTNGDELLAQAHPGPIPGPQGGPACIAAIDRTNGDHPVSFMHSPVSFAIQLQLAMSVPDSLGGLSYDAQSDALGIHWPQDGGTPSGMARAASFQRLIRQSGGGRAPFINGMIWHPLGGAAMNDACDRLGRLYGYENLFVIDGAMLPGSAAAVNPALTVAANAERIMEALVPQLRA